MTRQDQVITQDVEQRGKAVAPRDLFPLRIRPTAVRDRHLPDARARLRQARGDLYFKSETVGRERQTLDQIRPDQLVASLQVGQVQVREHVRQEREHAIADVVPEVEDTVVSSLKA